MPSGNPLLGRFALAFFEPFGSAGAATLMMIVSLWLVDFVARLFKEGVRPVLRQMSSLELYCVCWVAGALPSIVVTPYMPSRRFVIFLVPLVVIAALFTWRVWNARPDGRGDAPLARGQPARWLWANRPLGRDGGGMVRVRASGADGARWPLAALDQLEHFANAHPPGMCDRGDRRDRGDNRGHLFSVAGRCDCRCRSCWSVSSQSTLPSI